MDFIEFGHEHSLGVPELDKQHKELANRLNETIKHCTGKKADERKFFDKYSLSSIELFKNHFETEERLLKKTKYEHLSKHKVAHKEMLKLLKKIDMDVTKNRVELDLFVVTATIKEMVFKHLKAFDLDAKDYFMEGYKKAAR